MLKHALLVVCSVSLTACALPTDDEASTGSSSLGLDLATNVVRGQVRFTNSPTGAAATLYGSLLSGGGTTCFISASSTEGSGSASGPGAGLDPCSYEVTVPVKDTGSAYAFSVDRLGMPHTLVAPDVGGRRLVPASGPVTADFEQCFAVADLRVTRSCSAGSPGTVTLYGHGSMLPRSSVTASRYALPLAAGSSSQHSLPYRVTAVDGRSVMRSVTFNEARETFACDEVKVFELVIDECLLPLPSGVLTGPYDVLGEDETYAALFSAGSDTSNSYSFDRSAPFTAAVGDLTSYFRLPNLPSKQHWLSLTGNVRHGVGHTSFDVSTTATAIDGQTVIVARTDGDITTYPFVMTPAYLDASLDLYVPWVSDAASFQFPAPVVEIPDYYDGRGSASRVRYGAAGAGAESTFSGAFDAARKRFHASWETVLVSAYDQTLTWSRLLYLDFNHSDDRGALRGNLYVNPSSQADQFRVAPGERTHAGDEFCMGEAELTIEAQNGELIFAPSVNMGGGLNALDNGLGHAATYSVGGSFVGTPLQQASASSVGRVRIFAPKGSYSISPQMNIAKPNGSTQYVSLPAMQFEMPCGSSRFGAVQVSVTTTRCATRDGVSVQVRARKNQGAARISRIWYVLNGGPEVELACPGGVCSTNQVVNFTLPLGALAACGNTLEVFASADDALNVASYSVELESSLGCADSTCPAIIIDRDGDGIYDDADNCPDLANADQADLDADRLGDACDGDDDGDGIADVADNCPAIANADQSDVDGDALGDVCDGDIDGDGSANGADQCPGTAPGAYTNLYGCSILDLCPCSNFRNHGQFMTCVLAVRDTFGDRQRAHHEGTQLCR